MSQKIESFIEEVVRKIVSEKLSTSFSLLGTKKPVVVANWKMNMTAEKIHQFVNELTDELHGIETIVCPPFPYLYLLKGLLDRKNSSVLLGGQDVHTEPHGAFTGDVSAEQLKDIGTSYCLIGHSERRAIGETNEIIAKKVSQTLKVGVKPIICVGETEEERNVGRTNCVIKEQVLATVQHVQNPSNIVIAYEPVWAIGTGKSATPEQAQEVHQYIRSILEDLFGTISATIPILYGGSVKPENAKELSKMKDIDGALVGGASLKVEDFNAIINGFSKEAIA
ncbi:triose-phosphate isomerase [Bacillus salitolerans]|uniref:Triosephosphate isomerase n=1 Tax=Bacillus salitolerans TaxID=1437434 RepID=A0ABW4LPB9_9BACI